MMLKNVLAALAIFVIGLTGGILGSEIIWPYFLQDFFYYQFRPGQGSVYLTEIKQIYIQENVALVEAVERAGLTVAGVRTKTQSGKTLEGSGLVVTSDGLMVTLAELVPQGSEFSFFINQEKVSFQILKRNMEENLALVKISDLTLVTAGFARLENLKAGERVFLVGAVFEKENPLIAANEGIVKIFDENAIQTSIIESSFMAGSPLFNIKGEILGISMLNSAGRVTAVPVSKIKEFIGM